ncbi:universal stress protein [Edaphobacter paludis]|uniref:Universal stress protein n=1 Tax=Edaphobacter paludis TaxID=3035702 RepID=A0AAU7DAL4_9BACT
MAVIGDQVGLTVDRIVLATDFSPSSESATKYAKLLAKRFSSNLTLAHVVDLSMAARSEQAVVGYPIGDMRRASSENLERLLKDLTSDRIRATAQILEAHNPAAAIVGLAEQLKADLIVTGTHARHGLNKAILGSCAEGIFRHASCPVFTVGPKLKAPSAENIAFDRIVFATDFTSSAAEKAAVALAFAQDSMATIYLCHVLKDAGADISEMFELQVKFQSALKKMVPQSTLDWCTPECVVELGEVAPHILGLAKRVGADVIILGARRSSTWFAHLADGVVGHVLANAECPVMTICSS